VWKHHIFIYLDRVTRARLRCSHRYFNKVIGDYEENMCETTDIGSYWRLVCDNNAFHYGFHEGCEYGYMDIVKLMVNRGVSDWNHGFTVACMHGRANVAEYMITKGANDYNKGLCIACKHGHVDTAQLAITYGANAFYDGFRNACHGGHLGTVQLTKNFLSLPNVEEEFQMAWKSGSVELIEWFIQTYDLQSL